LSKVYLTIRSGIVHHGHIGIVNEAQKYGDVYIGLLSDEAMVSDDRVPLINFANRKLIFSNITGVTAVLKQQTLDCRDNLVKIKPDFVIYEAYEASNMTPPSKDLIQATLANWGGKLINLASYNEPALDRLEEQLSSTGITPHRRRAQLRKLLATKPLVRIMEAHSGLTGLIVEKTVVEEGHHIKSFDGMWVSSLCDSITRGKPDIELVDLTSRLHTINEIMEVTTKPIIYDGDTGGKIEHFVYTVRTLERLGVSAVIIEDKVGLKKNSLFGTDVKQKQDTIEHFQAKLSAGKEAQVTADFMVIARIESLILKAGIEDALQRAQAYITAGADGIMIHSKSKDPQEILEFCEKYREFDNRVPLIVVPSSYSIITENELMAAGANIVIYANQLIRGAYPAMVKVAQSILKEERAFESESLLMPISEILTLIPGAK